MKIAFNATSLLAPLTGIGQYSRQLALGLTQRPDLEPTFFYGSHWSPQLWSEPLPGAGKILPWLRSNLPFAYDLRRIVQSNRFCSSATTDRFDLYHEPNILPLPFEGPTVITVHDLSWIRYPESHPKERVAAMNRHFETGLLRASLILTDSAFVKNELIDLFQVKEEKICVAPLGVEPLFCPRSIQETGDTLARWKLKHGCYFLAVGTMEPRKNLQTALDAYARLPTSIRQHFPMVLSGMSGWNSSKLEGRIRNMAKDGTLINVGYVSRTDLAVLLAGATSLVFPSIYEGFGLPLLEAMACGVPVISSNAASMPEVVGETGVLLDPYDADGMTMAMERFASSPEECRHLGRLGLERSRLFTWDACVSATVQAYYQTLGQIPFPS